MKNLRKHGRLQELDLRVLIGIASILILVIVFFVGSGMLLPTAKGDVAQFYITNSLDKIVSANAVNAIIWEFRGYDTLGEELVLITASLSVFVLLYKKKR